MGRRCEIGVDTGPNGHKMSIIIRDLRIFNKTPNTKRVDLYKALIGDTAAQPPDGRGAVSCLRLMDAGHCWPCRSRA